MVGFVEAYLDARKLKTMNNKLTKSQQIMESIFMNIAKKPDLKEIYDNYSKSRQDGQLAIDRELKKFKNFGLDIEVGTAVNLMTNVSDIDLMVIVDNLVYEDKEVNEKLFEKLTSKLSKIGYLPSGEHGTRKTPNHWFLFNNYDFKNDIEIELKIRNKADAGDIMLIHKNLSALSTEQSSIIVYMKHLLRGFKWTYTIFKAILYEWMYSISKVSIKRLFNMPPGYAWKIGLLQENKDKPIEWKRKIWNMDL